MNYFTAQELKERMVANDNRATSMPYLLLLREKRVMVVDGEFHGKLRYVETTCGDYPTSDTKKELLDTIKNWYSTEEEFLEADYNIQEYYEEEWEDTINVFLTDQGYKDHVKVNGHTLAKHDTYGIHAFRNKEMSSLLNLIDENIKLRQFIVDADMMSEYESSNVKIDDGKHGAKN